MNKRLEQTSIQRDDDEDKAPKGRSRRPAMSAAERAEETRLVERAQAGDNEAFRQLFQRYHRRAYSLALGVVRNPDDALDVVQDGFIKAHRYIDRFEGNSSFYTWLYRIIMNLAIDHLRKHKRGRHVDYQDALSHEGGEENQSSALAPRILGQNPGKALVRREIREHISLALSELSDNHRAVLVMRELEGLSYEEMADAMDCSKGTIMSRLFHARKNMQRRLIELMGQDVASDLGFTAEDGERSARKAKS